MPRFQVDFQIGWFDQLDADDVDDAVQQVLATPQRILTQGANGESRLIMPTNGVMTVGPAPEPEPAPEPAPDTPEA